MENVYFLSKQNWSRIMANHYNCYYSWLRGNQYEAQCFVNMDLKFISYQNEMGFE